MQKNYHTDNKSFMIYKDWEEYIQLLTDEEAGRLFKALFAFAKRNEEADFDGAMKVIFTFMKNTFERDGKKWEDICTHRYERKNRSAKSSENEDKDTDTEKDKDTVIVTDIDKEKEPPKGRRSAKGGNSAAGGKDRSAEKKIIKDQGHSYDLNKLVEYAMTHTPTFPAKQDSG